MSKRNRKKHNEHWREPKIISDTRQPGEKYCEFCGEDIPWHKSMCKMLLLAFRMRGSYDRQGR